MVINESGCGSGTWVADEQSGQEPKTFWDPSEKEFCRELQANLAIDLGQSITLTELSIYSKESTEGTITPFLKSQGKTKITISLKSGWNKIPLSITADLLYFDMSKGVKLGEILVDASRTFTTIAPISKDLRAKPLMHDFIGTNAFVDVPVGLLEPFGPIREYHDWSWNEPVKDDFSFNKTKNGFHSQLFYTNLQKGQKLAIATLQKAPNWLSSPEQGKPVEKNESYDLPKSYNRHSFFMHLYAENFNKTANGAVRYFENWNEHDKWWEGGISYFTPSQYASMSSADVDGHLHTLGPNHGIKAPQSTIKMVMSGLADPKTDYIHALKYWCDRNRKGDFIWDVINYHHYSNNAPPNGPSTEGVCPEKGNSYQKAKEICDFRDKYLPKVEVWNSEFGFDTEKSTQVAKPIGTKSSELVQSDWLIRSYLLMSATGLDKAFQFMIRDFGKEGTYATCGVYSSTLKEQPYIKPSWYYIYTLRNVLYNSVFEELKVDSMNQIYSVVYKNTADPTLKTTIVWLGTQEGKSTKKYQFHTSARNQYRLIEFSANSVCGHIKAFPKGELEISETPLIIQEQPKGVFSACKELKKVNGDSISCLDEVSKENRQLLDEQITTVNPAFGIGKQSPATYWTPGYQKNKEESRTFDFGKERVLHSVYFYDGSGEGEISLSIKENGQWKQIGLLNLDLYNQWKGYVVNVSTRYMKITRTSGGGDVGEIYFYETKTY